MIEALVAAATDTAFRSVEVRRMAPEPHGPALVLANHGGGLGDILTVIAGCKRFPRFLARDIIWRIPVARQIMNTVGAIPVSRRQDHGGAADNTSMFDAAFEGLENGDLLAIYPEGESIAEPRLAPLRTGAARILLGAWARGVDVSIVPMGLHYFDISVLRGRCLVEVGPPVRMSELVPGLPSDQPLAEANHEAVKALTAVISERLGAVVAEYADWDQRKDFEAAATVYLHAVGTGDDVSYSDLATTAEQISQAPPAARELVRRRLQAHSAALELLGLRESELPQVALTSRQLANRTGRLLALAPFAAYGATVNGLPMVGLRAISLTGVAPATAASLKPAFAMIAFPAMWTALGWWGYRRGGLFAAALMASTGPASLGATVAVAEQGQLMVMMTRAYRRAKGPALDQLLNARESLVEAVGEAINSQEAR
ncbi:MAG: 1-acyl-sn-glycerol-3-phosphate acyltransferase [Candidatus Nanopelagicales bacterium]|jgi:1-acyl-sn-glycerol-3-phosphate acyltransferase|nr:1-acyl-sn-glycerol-3-phosphate acyltransferase [Candidatus Nanopelagicales bacterium]